MSELCKYCMVCTKPCSDDCKDFVPSKEFEFLELKWELDDNTPDQFKEELSYKQKVLSAFSIEELEEEIKRRNMKESVIDRIDEIRANSVTDEEFKQTWSKSIDEAVDKASKAWDEKLKKYKPKKI